MTIPPSDRMFGPSLGLRGRTTCAKPLGVSHEARL